MTGKELGELAAFAVPTCPGLKGQEGMTKREYYAGQIMAGIVAKYGIALRADFDAPAAVAIADALLTELAKDDPA